MAPIKPYCARLSDMASDIIEYGNKGNCTFNGKVLITSRNILASCD